MLYIRSAMAFPPVFGVSGGGKFSRSRLWWPVGDSAVWTTSDGPGCFSAAAREERFHCGVICARTDPAHPVRPWRRSGSTKRRDWNCDLLSESTTVTSGRSARSPFSSAATASEGFIRELIARVRPWSTKGLVIRGELAHIVRWLRPLVIWNPWVTREGGQRATERSP